MRRVGLTLQIPEPATSTGDELFNAPASDPECGSGSRPEIVNTQAAAPLEICAAKSCTAGSAARFIVTGVMVLRVQRPELERPFRIPLYPLPPLAAMAGFVFILVNRSHALGGLAAAGGIACSGTVIYLVRARRLGQWPFGQVRAKCGGSRGCSDSSRSEKRVS